MTPAIVRIAGSETVLQAEATRNPHARWHLLQATYSPSPKNVPDFLNGGILFPVDTLTRPRDNRQVVWNYIML